MTALIELQGTSLLGSRLNLTKHDPNANPATAMPRKRNRDGSLVDDEIQAMLLEREVKLRG